MHLSLMPKGENHQFKFRCQGLNCLGVKCPEGIKCLGVKCPVGVKYQGVKGHRGQSVTFQGIILLLPLQNSFQVFTFDPPLEQCAL